MCRRDKTSFIHEPVRRTEVGPRFGFEQKRFISKRNLKLGNKNRPGPKQTNYFNIGAATTQLRTIKGRADNETQVVHIKGEHEGQEED